MITPMMANVTPTASPTISPVVIVMLKPSEPEEGTDDCWLASEGWELLDIVGGSVA